MNVRREIYLRVSTKIKGKMKIFHEAETKRDRLFYDFLAYEWSATGEFE